MKKNEIHNRSRIRNKKENIHRVKKNRHIIKSYIFDFFKDVMLPIHVHVCNCILYLLRFKQFDLYSIK